MRRPAAAAIWAAREDCPGESVLVWTPHVFKALSHLLPNWNLAASQWSRRDKPLLPFWGERQKYGEVKGFCKVPQLMRTRLHSWPMSSNLAVSRAAPVPWYFSWIAIVHGAIKLRPFQEMAFLDLWSAMACLLFDSYWNFWHKSRKRHFCHPSLWWLNERRFWIRGDWRAEISYTRGSWLAEV